MCITIHSYNKLTRICVVSRIDRDEPFNREIELNHPDPVSLFNKIIRITDTPPYHVIEIMTLSEYVEMQKPFCKEVK